MPSQLGIWTAEYVIFEGSVLSYHSQRVFEMRWILVVGNTTVQCHTYTGSNGLQVLCFLTWNWLRSQQGPRRQELSARRECRLLTNDFRSWCLGSEASEGPWTSGSGTLPLIPSAPSSISLLRKLKLNDMWAADVGLRLMFKRNNPYNTEQTQRIVWSLGEDETCRASQTLLIEETVIIDSLSRLEQAACLPQSLYYNRISSNEGRCQKSLPTFPRNYSRRESRQRLLSPTLGSRL